MYELNQDLVEDSVLDPGHTRYDRHHGEGRERRERHPAQRDRDRILYTFHFRRLAGITQVVRAGEGALYHNRLTHSLKVAQLGRRLSQYLLKDNEGDLIERVGGIDPNVVETASLAHDLGHPPFGHAAETELGKKVGKKGISDGFEGNPQSFRIVTEVAARSEKHNGLNLTRASLNAILKYPWTKEAGGKKEDKWGTYHSEKDHFDFAREESPAEEDQKSAEAAIMDWADDLAYAIHDMDDFHRAGAIPLGQILLDSTNGSGSERDEFISKFFEEKRDDITSGFDPHDFLDNLADSPVTAGIKPSYKGTIEERAALDSLTAFLIRRYTGVEEGSSNGDSVVRLQDSDSEFLRIKPEAKDQITLLKYLVMHYVFDDTALAAQQYGHREIIEDLFEILFDCSIKEGSYHADIIPRPFQQKMREVNDIRDEDEQERKRARLVSDIIASMTEQQAITLHKRLTGDSPKTVLNRVLD